MKENYGNKCIFGIRPIIEAIENEIQIDKALIQKGLKGNLFNDLKELIKIHKISCQYVPIQKINRLTKKNHQGVYAFISPVSFYSTEEIVMDLYDKGQTPKILILDRISDVRNFGAIVRSAECLGIHAVIIPEKGAAQVNSDSIKTSAGALLKIPICKEKSLVNTIKNLKQNGLEIIACTEKSSIPVYKHSFNKPLAIIMGSEKDGISSDILKLSDVKLKIPLKGSIESLNVSVATGIILFEASKK